MHKVLEDEYSIHSPEREQKKEEVKTFSSWNEGQQEVYRSLSAEQKQTAMHISREVTGTAQRHGNVMRAYETQLEGSHKDMRVVKILLHGAQVDETGAPLNVEEGRHMLEDSQRIQSYLSNDPAVSGPLLASVVEEVLSYPYLDVDLKKELKSHPAELHAILDKNVYMQNMITDHPEYFNTLPEETMTRLKAAMNLGAIMSTYVIALSTAQGIEFNSGMMYEEFTPVKTLRNSMDIYRQTYEAAKAAYRQATGR